MLCAFLFCHFQMCNMARHFTQMTEANLIKEHCAFLFLTLLKMSQTFKLMLHNLLLGILIRMESEMVVFDIQQKEKKTWWKKKMKFFH